MCLRNVSGGDGDGFGSVIRNVTLTNKSSSTLAPGIQKPTNDRMAVVEACEDKYAFATEVGNAEVLEPQSLTEAK